MGSERGLGLEQAELGIFRIEMNDRGDVPVRTVESNVFAHCS